MDVSTLASAAAQIIVATINKTSDGAVQKVGSDIVDFLKKQFQGRLQIESAKPEALEADILSKAERDPKFREDLARLVSQYEQIKSNSPHISQSGVNINVNHNTGKVTGQENTFFRFR